MLKLLAVLALAAGLWSAPANAQQLSPCQASSGSVNGVSCLRMNGRFFTTGPGKGVETEALLGLQRHRRFAASDTLTIDYRDDSAGTAQSLDFASGADGLASATWSTANQTLTLTLVDGTNIPVALSGLETQAEVAAAITAAIANRLTRADIIAGNNITISNWLRQLA